EVHPGAAVRRSHRKAVPHRELRRAADDSLSHVDDRPQRAMGVAVEHGVVRLQPGRNAAAEHADHDRAGGGVQEQRVAAGRRRQHRLHHLQFPRHSRRLHRQSHGQLRALHQRHLVHLRRHGGGHGVHSPVAHELFGEPGVEPAVTRAGEQGTSLMEVLVATALLVTLMAGRMSMAGVAISTTENQGHLAARTTEYAQDKMEQLLALAYTDTASDTRSFPAATSGGSGLAIGGSYNVDAPVALYVDYLDGKGHLGGSAGAACVAPSGTVAPTGWYYKRVWKVELAGTNLKQITVAAATSRGFGGSVRATSYLSVLKTSPF